MAKLKRKSTGPGDGNPGTPKRPREDFFKAQAFDKDLDERFHRALIAHIAETCTSFKQLTILAGKGGISKVLVKFPIYYDDSADVTLARRDGELLEAHKVILKIFDDVLSKLLLWRRFDFAFLGQKKKTEMGMVDFSFSSQKV